MKTGKLSTNVHGMEAVWTLTSLIWEKLLSVPEIWYTAGEFTRLKTKRRPGHIKKYAKSKGLPSYQYEVDIPFIDVRPCV